MPVSASIYAGATVNHTGVHDLATPVAKIGTGRKTFEFLNGTSAGKADRVFGDIRQLAASASENLDLAGSLADAFGAVITFAKIVAIFVKAAEANTGDIIVGGAAANGFVGPFGAAAHTVAVKPGGALALVAPQGGWTVTAGTGDLLKIANAVAAAAEYEIVLLGTSA